MGTYRPGKRGQGRGETVNHQTSPRAKKGAKLAPHYQGNITDPETVTIECKPANECESNARSAANTAAESSPKQETGENMPTRGRRKTSNPRKGRKRRNETTGERARRRAREIRRGRRKARKKWKDRRFREKLWKTRNWNATTYPHTVPSGMMSYLQGEPGQNHALGLDVFKRSILRARALAPKNQKRRKKEYWKKTSKKIWECWWNNISYEGPSPSARRDLKANMRPE